VVLKRARVRNVCTGAAHLPLKTKILVFCSKKEKETWHHAHKGKTYNKISIFLSKINAS
jgi:hypothetical protein